MKEIFLTQPWEFSNVSNIIVEEDGVRTEFIILEKSSFFGDEINKLKIKNISSDEILFLSNHDNVKFFKKEGDF